MVGTPGPSGTRATSRSSLSNGRGGRREGTELPGADLLTVLRSAVRGGGRGGLCSEKTEFREKLEAERPLPRVQKRRSFLSALLVGGEGPAPRPAACAPTAPRLEALRGPGGGH